MIYGVLSSSLTYVKLEVGSRKDRKIVKEILADSFKKFDKKDKLLRRININKTVISNIAENH